MTFFLVKLGRSRNNYFLQDPNHHDFDMMRKKSIAKLLNEQNEKKLFCHGTRCFNIPNK